MIPLEAPLLSTIWPPWCSTGISWLSPPGCLELATVFVSITMVRCLRYTPVILVLPAITSSSQLPSKYSSTSSSQHSATSNSPLTPCIHLNSTSGSISWSRILSSSSPSRRTIHHRDRITAGCGSSVIVAVSTVSSPIWD